MSIAWEKNIVALAYYMSDISLEATLGCSQFYQISIKIFKIADNKRYTITLGRYQNDNKSHISMRLFYDLIDQSMAYRLINIIDMLITLVKKVMKHMLVFVA